MLGTGDTIADLIRSRHRGPHLPGEGTFWARYPELVAFGLVLAVLLLLAHTDPGLEDDAYLWYGVQRVLAGEIPLRDFQSYDPGRYYWAAGFMAVLGSHGFFALQVAISFCAAIGAGLAARLVFRANPKPGLVIPLLVALCLFMWMIKRHKLFDVTASVVSVALLAWLIEQPTRYRCFMTGLGVGLIAIVGRNHGLYAALADVAAILCVALVEDRARPLPALGYWGTGMVIGYSPMLFAVALVPGFWTGFWATLQVYYEIGATNLSVRIPWPWLVSLHWPPVKAARYVLVGLLLVALPAFGVTVAAWSVWRSAVRKIRVDPLVFACALLAITYTHHAFARAGEGHLAQAVFPMLIGVFALITRLPRPGALILMTAALALSTFLLLPSQLLYVRYLPGQNWVTVQVGPDRLLVHGAIASRITALARLIRRYAPSGQEFVAEPSIPGAYALADRRAAVWNTYPNVLADTALQEREIQRMRAEHPAFVLIASSRYPYRATNPLVYGFIVRNYVKVADPALPRSRGWQLYLPSDRSPSPNLTPSLPAGEKP